MSQSNNKTRTAKPAHVVCQPIYDRNRGLYAYELNFHQTGDSTADDAAGARALLEMNELTDNNLALVRLPLEFLIDYRALLPNADNMGIKVPCAECCADERAAAILQEVSLLGFTLILDDFTWQPGVEKLLQRVDVVLIDTMKTGLIELEELAQRLGEFSVKLLAKNVETQEYFDLCKEMGFDYFQGFFLCKPRVVGSQKLSGNKLNTMRLMTALQSPDVDSAKLDSIIRSDLTLHYGLLRTVNSTYYGLRVEVSSIAHAINYLGIPTVRRWASLQLLAGGEGKPSEVLRLALIRGWMCEHLIPNLSKEKRDKAFTTGLFSLLDATFETPMEQILEKLPLDQELVSALTSFSGPYGRLLQTVISYENGDWQELESSQLFSLDEISECHLQAVSWARDQFAALGA